MRGLQWPVLLSHLAFQTDLPRPHATGNPTPLILLSLSLGLQIAQGRSYLHTVGQARWVVVKIMVPFWVP